MTSNLVRNVRCVALSDAIPFRIGNTAGCGAFERGTHPTSLRSFIPPSGTTFDENARPPWTRGDFRAVRSGKQPTPALRDRVESSQDSTCAPPLPGRGFSGEPLMPPSGTTFDENVGAARASADARVAIAGFASKREIAAGDSGSHSPAIFIRGLLSTSSCLLVLSQLRLQRFA